MAENSILDFETLLSDFQELLNGSGLTLTFKNGDKNKVTNKTIHVKRKLLWTTSTLSALLKMATFPKHFYI